MPKYYVGSRFLIAVTVAASLACSAPAAAQASAYVPINDPAYHDLDALVAAGLVRDLMLGTRPYSRANFARAIAEAKNRVEKPIPGRAAPSPKPRISEALTRLQARFGTDGFHGIRGAELLASVGDTPTRSVLDREGSYGIDADIAPLVQRNNGRTIPDGSSIGGEVWGDLTLGTHFAAALQPRVWLSAPRADDGGIGAELVTGYARALFGNVAVDVGRNTLARGHSREMDPTLSTNARALDMVRISTERAGRLPWVFRYLGAMTAAGSISTLGDNRQNPGGFIVVWEGSVRPVRILELGLTLVSQQGGEGTPEATLRERILETLFIAKRTAGVTQGLWWDPLIGDKFFGGEARLAIPRTGIDMYAEFGITDDHEFFFAHPHASLVYEAAWLGGFRWRGLGNQGRLDLWAEAAHNGAGPYIHTQMRSGMTLDRRVLGSPLGPLAIAFQGGATWAGKNTRLSFTGAWEQYPNDQYGYDTGTTTYFRTVDNPDEIRLRTTAEWVREDPLSRLTTRVKLGYEGTTRFAFTEQNRSSVLLQAGMGWTW